MQTEHRGDKLEHSVDIFSLLEALLVVLLVPERSNQLGESLNLRPDWSIESTSTCSLKMEI